MEEYIKALEQSVASVTLGQSLGEEEDKPYNEIVHKASAQRVLSQTVINLSDEHIPELDYRRLDGMPLFSVKELVTPPCCNILCDSGPNFVDESEENGFVAYHSFKSKFFSSVDWCSYCRSVLYNVDGLECECCGIHIHTKCLSCVLKSTCYGNGIWKSNEIPPLPPSPQIIDDDDNDINGGDGNNNNVDNEVSLFKFDNDNSNKPPSPPPKNSGNVSKAFPNTGEALFKYEISIIEGIKGEIIETEQKYVESLSVTVRFVDGCKNFYDEQTLNKMFPNVREIFTAHYKYLRLIYSGKNLFEYFSDKLSPLIKSLYPEYCSAYQGTLDEIKKRYDSDPKFKQYFVDFHKRYGDSQKFYNSFSTVFQRLMRYGTLLEELVKKIGPDNPEPSSCIGCRKMLECAKETSAYINDNPPNSSN